MIDPRSSLGHGRVLVSDLDGTMTRHDFYKLAVGRLLPPEVPDHWGTYREGTITHFEALRLYFAATFPSERMLGPRHRLPGIALVHQHHAKWLQENKALENRQDRGGIGGLVLPTG